MNRTLLVVCVALWLGWVGWAGGIFYMSSMSGQELHETIKFEFWDKAAHFIAFAFGGVLAAAALRAGTRWPWWRVVLIAILLLALFGGSDEYHQLYTPGRSGADVWDWLADVLGATFGAFLTALCWRWLPTAWQPAASRV